MKRLLVALLGVVVAMTTMPAAAQPDDDQLRIIAFGAHPDDSELNAGGVAALWAEQGHAVKFVSMTNGDIGHFGMAGGPLAVRREQEVQQCAEDLGIEETEVLDIHDGELMPTLENRKTVARLIREWQADIVLFHRPYDYHADHRYTGVLVEDASVLVTAPFFTPTTPPVEGNPVFMYMYDRFERPYPFEPSIVVNIDDTAEKKWACIRNMPSQFGDPDSWQASTRPDVPEDEEDIMEYLLEQRQRSTAAMADRFRSELIELYGQERGSEVEYAEAFMISEYGSQPTQEQLKALFPTFE